MADRYIDSTYVESFLGTNLVTAITSVSGVVLNTQIEAATAAVQMFMRNSGYATPTSTDPTEIEEAVKVAVLGALLYTLLQVPETKIVLPEGIENHTALVAWRGILSGEAQLAASVDVSAAVGGWQASEHRSSVTGAYTQKASRKELEGF